MNKSKHRAKGYLEHKDIQGRKDEDIASVAWKFLLESEHRDCKNTTWYDVIILQCRIKTRLCSQVLCKIYQYHRSQWKQSL